MGVIGAGISEPEKTLPLHGQFLLPLRARLWPNTNIYSGSKMPGLVELTESNAIEFLRELCLIGPVKP